MSRRLPPEDWQQELERVGGTPNEQISWLTFWWEPEIERWELYELIPVGALRAKAKAFGTEHLVDEELAALQGPSPESQRAFQRAGEHGMARVSFSPVTQQQWELYRETGCCARRFWIIEGKDGGHKRFLTPKESQMLKMAGRRPQLPEPGSLPYAPWDRRVADKIRAMDRLRQFDRHWGSRTAKDVAHERKQAGERFGKELLRWLDSQIRDAVSAASPIMPHASELPRNDDQDLSDEAMEAAEATFIRELGAS